MMHGREKSDAVVVAAKPTNKSRATGGGVGGAKDSAREERERAKHAPDSAPGARVTGARARTAKHHFALTSSTLARSRMREFRTSGSVRGAASNGRPYRELISGAGRQLRQGCVVDEHREWQA